MELINMCFIGHLGDPAKVAGVGIANVYINMVSQSWIMGLNGALSTFVAQAYGAENMRLCGIYLNRGRFVTLLAFIP
jgi:Na+-driven multidrug efflux pump